ncbi:MAG: hypothetical protein OEY96_00555 [Gammaproteobacteria bacterium]|nr:hypothetical protein [Gammaproteobacteria bacterium]
MSINRILGMIFLAVFTTPALAAPMDSWVGYVLLMIAISLTVGIYLSRRNEKADSRLSKILLAGLYFWITTFAQLILFAIYYHFTQ